MDLRRRPACQQRELGRRQHLHVKPRRGRVVGPHLEAETALHPAWFQPRLQFACLGAAGNLIGLLERRRAFELIFHNGPLRHDAAHDRVDLERFITGGARPCLDFQLRLSRPVMAAEWIGEPQEGCPGQLRICQGEKEGQRTGAGQR